VSSNVGRGKLVRTQKEKTALDSLEEGGGCNVMPGQKRKTQGGEGTSQFVPVDKFPSFDGLVGPPKYKIGGKTGNSFFGRGKRSKKTQPTTECRRRKKRPPILSHGPIKKPNQPPANQPQPSQDRCSLAYKYARKITILKLKRIAPTQTTGGGQLKIRNGVAQPSKRC